MWIIKSKKYRQEYEDMSGAIYVTYEKGIECKCSYCGWKTGSQAVDFVFCPKCGEKNGNDSMQGDEKAP